ncbi:hypothetical protein Nepgr_024440 [Nepenthes gracilis]|uniref:Uncharacterized protein n=1 Tax=Nepenthes gracilis TaxID=150966 RepID=A0AAD3T4L7_NEPGR|nr:hypothetical protein Nepgr_024440 [Nepenthes gracilis]
MSLNCLNCQVLHRTNSDDSRRLTNGVLCCKAMAGRSWSGNLTPPPYYEKAGSFGKTKNKVKPDRRRNGSAEIVEYGEEISEPKLLRSGGMRRDWSFECLDHIDMKRKLGT